MFVSSLYLLFILFFKVLSPFDDSPPYYKYMTSQTLAEKIKNVLIGLRSYTPDVEGIVLVDMNGLPIISILPCTEDDSYVSAMAISILGTGQRTVDELKLGKLRKVVVQGENGYVIFVDAGRDAILAVLAAKISKLDIILVDVALVAQNVANILAERE